MGDPVSRYEVDDICAGKHKGNEQSELAFSAVKKSRVKQRAKIYGLILDRACRGATTEEASIALSIRYSAASARMSELRKDGLIKESGETRNTTAGRAAAVMIAEERYTVGGNNGNG